NIPWVAFKPDVANRAGLKRYPGDIVFLELAHQRDCFLVRWNTGRADHAIDGRTIGTRTRNQTTALNLGTPLLRGQVHGVELSVNARVQHVLESFQRVIQNRVRDLTATSKLCPESSIGSCGNNRGIHRRRSHTGKYHWGIPGYFGKPRGQTCLALIVKKLRRILGVDVGDTMGLVYM